MSEARSGMTAAVESDEIAYRSLSTLAVLSLLLGFGSLLSFAPSPFFMWTLPPAAIITGLLAMRQIASAPEVWTGKRLAHIGTALAVVSALGAGVYKYVKSERVHRHGRVFADRFVDKIRTGDVEGAFWLTLPRERRGQFMGKQLAELGGDVLDRYQTFRTQLAPYTEALAAGKATVEFEKLESAIMEGSSQYAAVVYNFSSSEGSTSLLVVAASGLSPETHQQSWFIREHQFGYSAQSFRPPSQEGHGHAH